LAAGEGKDVEELMATLRKEHDRAERRLGAALAEQRRSTDRNDAAVGLNAGPFELLAEDSAP
jgi:hypothetical protein